MTSPPRGLELTETCSRACLCSVDVYRQNGKRLLRDDPFAINIQLTNDDNDGGPQGGGTWSPQQTLLHLRSKA